MFVKENPDRKKKKKKKDKISKANFSLTALALLSEAKSNFLCTKG